jgi:hypothetical protein
VLTVRAREPLKHNAVVSSSEELEDKFQSPRLKMLRSHPLLLRAFSTIPPMKCEKPLDIRVKTTLKSLLKSRSLRPHDIVQSFARLSQISRRDPDIWESVTENAVTSAERLKPSDISTIIKSMARVGYRDEILLMQFNELIRYQSKLTVSDITSILNSYHQLNFVPSAETLNHMIGELKRSEDLHRWKNSDTVRLFRYFNQLSKENIVVSQLSYPFIHRDLETRVQREIGKYGPVEILIILQNSNKIGINEIILNFFRNEKIDLKLFNMFLNCLNRKFGPGAWRKYKHLFRIEHIDSTGWNLKPELDSDDEDEDRVTYPRTKFSRIHLNSDIIAELFKLIPKNSKGEKLPQNPEIRQIRDFDINSDQLELLKEMEFEIDGTRSDAGGMIGYYDRIIDRKFNRKRNKENIGKFKNYYKKILNRKKKISNKFKFLYQLKKLSPVDRNSS